MVPEATRNVPNMKNTISLPCSIGELCDKLTILTIKLEQITDPDKLQNITVEYHQIKTIYNDKLLPTIDLPKFSTFVELLEELLNMNRKIWDIEDAIRKKEKAQQFDQEFIELARSVYINNDKRAAIKKQINIHLGSTIVEEKSY